jgi:hypothetical protein
VLLAVLRVARATALDARALDPVAIFIRCAIGLVLTCFEANQDLFVLSLFALAANAPVDALTVFAFVVAFITEIGLSAACGQHEKKRPAPKTTRFHPINPLGAQVERTAGKALVESTKDESPAHLHELGFPNNPGGDLLSH